MKTKESLVLPENLRYTAEHVWVRKDGDAYVVGVTDFAQDQLGEVSFVDIVPGGHCDAGDEFGTIESVKAVNGLFMPFAGTVIEVNPALEDAPSMVNASCYDAAWLARIEADSASAMDGLLDAEAYRAQLA